MKKHSIRSLSPFFAATALVVFALLTWGLAAQANDLDRLAACGTGQYQALLTGWTLNGSTPTGNAHYSSKDKRLEIKVEKVDLKDGTVLDVRIGDDKIGKMEPIKDKSATTVITIEDELDEKSRVRIFNDDVPILSANLACDSSPEATTKATPTF